MLQLYVRCIHCGNTSNPTYSLNVQQKKKATYTLSVFTCVGLLAVAPAHLKGQEDLQGYGSGHAQRGHSLGTTEFDAQKNTLKPKTLIPKP